MISKRGDKEFFGTDTPHLSICSFLEIEKWGHKLFMIFEKGGQRFFSPFEEGVKELFQVWKKGVGVPRPFWGPKILKTWRGYPLNFASSISNVTGML